jgi:hypothetical protein
MKRGRRSLFNLLFNYWRGIKLLGMPTVLVTKKAASLATIVYAHLPSRRPLLSKNLTTSNFTHTLALNPPDHKPLHNGLTHTQRQTCTHRTAFNARARGSSAKNPKLTHTLGNTNTLTHRTQPWFNPRDFVSLEQRLRCLVWRFLVLLQRRLSSPKAPRAHSVVATVLPTPPIIANP